jgi:hypothetical protein
MTGGSSARAREIVIVDPRTGVHARLPAGPLRFGPPGAAAESPARAAGRVRRAWGIDVAYLGWWDVGPEFELLPGRAAPRDWRWTEWRPTPALDARLEWERPGWVPRVAEIVDVHLEALGRRRTGVPEQIRHTSLNAVLRIPADRGDIWYKAGLPIFAHEGPVVARLHRLSPRGLPTVLAQGSTWWLSDPFPPARTPPRANPFAALADLQVAATVVAHGLARDGAPRRSLPQLADAIDRLAARGDLVDDAHAALLRLHGGRLRELCDEAAGCFPESVVHGDFHARNRRWTADGWFFFDWTDCVVSCPLLDLSLTHRLEPPARLARARAAFAARWKRELPGRDVDHAIDLSEALGAAHQAVNYARIADGLPGPPRDDVTGEVRTWVRRLDRAMRALGQAARARVQR